MNNLITAAAGFGGALVGASATLLSGSFQSRREIQRETVREARDRAVKAADDCYELLSDFVEALESGFEGAEGVSVLGGMRTLSPAVQEINGSILKKCVYLPREVRYRVHLARLAMVYSQEIESGNYHYLPKGTIVRYSASQAQQTLVAFMCNEEIPRLLTQTLELDVALKEHHVDYHARTKDHREKFAQRKQEFQESHPELYKADDATVGRKWWQFRKITQG